MSADKKQTRAEMVRYRREQEYLKQLQRASNVTPRSTVPLNTQAKKNAVKHVRKPADPDRRRFQIALTTAPQTDGHSFRIPRPQLGWRLLSFFLALMFGVLIYLAFTRPELQATEAQLTGNQMISQAEINAVLNIAGKPVFMLTPSELEDRLRLNFPELASVRVDVSLPNHVAVEMTERKPVIRWEQGDSYTWIADDGVAFRPHGEMQELIPVLALSAPVVEPLPAGQMPDPLTPTPFISTEMVQALQGLVGHVPQGQSILYDKDFGFGWNDPRGWRVHFGTNAHDIELKMLVYETMVNTLNQKGIRPALVNVMYPSAPYYRLDQ